MTVEAKTAADVVSAARALLRVSWVHQGRREDAGLDCLGLLVAVGRRIGCEVPDDASYGRIPDGEELLAGMRRYLLVEPIGTAPRPGHAVALRVGLKPHHVGFVGDYRDGVSLIHGNVKAGGVCEHRMTPHWLAAIVELYRLPGVTYP
jgi:hypothetical protein